MNLLILEPAEYQPGQPVRVAGERARHLRDVLQARPGQILRAGVLNGPTGRLTLTAYDGDAALLAGELNDLAPEEPALDILVALPRPKVLKRLWAQWAALGVRRIILTNAGSVEKFYFDSHALTENVYRPLLLEGLQQAGVTRLPQVSVHDHFGRLLREEMDGVSDAALRVAADPAGAERLTSQPERFRGQSILLAVGPENGWSEAERALLLAHRFSLYSLGARVLRCDTASIALIGILRELQRG